MEGVAGVDGVLLLLLLDFSRLKTLLILFTYLPRLLRRSTSLAAFGSAGPALAGGDMVGWRTPSGRGARVKASERVESGAGRRDGEMEVSGRTCRPQNTPGCGCWRWVRQLRGLGTTAGAGKKQQLGAGAARGSRNGVPVEGAGGRGDGRAATSSGEASRTGK